VKDQSHGTNASTGADMYPSKNLCVGADINIIADHWYGSVFVPIANGNAMSHRATRPDDRIGMHNNISKVPNSQSGTDHTFLRQCDAGQRFDHSVHHPVHL